MTNHTLLQYKYTQNTTNRHDTQVSYTVGLEHHLSVGILLGGHARVRGEGLLLLTNPGQANTTEALMAANNELNFTAMQRYRTWES